MSFGGQSRRPGAGLATWALLAGFGLLAGLGVALYVSLPRLDTTVPPSGAQFVSSLAPVRLNVNRPMDLAAVEAALQITPQRLGNFEWQGQTLTFATYDQRLAAAATMLGFPLFGV